MTAENLLLQEIKYLVRETRLGVWRRFMYSNGEVFAEFVAHRRILGLPLIHYTCGRCPETGKRIVARGVIAIGRVAVGVFALGHLSAGLFAMGQLAIGLLFGLGQGATGTACIGQLAIGVVLGLGQVATGYIAVGQLGVGQYVLAQFGLGTHVWDMRQAAPAARQFFEAFMFWKGG